MVNNRDRYQRILESSLYHAIHVVAVGSRPAGLEAEGLCTSNGQQITT